MPVKPNARNRASSSVALRGARVEREIELVPAAA